MSNVLVLGGTGFVGRFLIAELIAHGCVPFVPVRPSHSLESLTREFPQAEFFVVTHFTDITQIKPLIEQVDAVVNLAGSTIMTRWTESEKRKIVDSRSGITKALVKAFEQVKRKPRVFVNASAVGFFNRCEKACVETDRRGRGFLAQVCDAWETEAFRAKALGIKVVVPRLGVVLHPENGMLKVMSRVYRSFLGGPMGPGTQPFPWIHVSDVVRFIRTVVCSDSGEYGAGVYHLVAPEQVTMDDFSEQFSKFVKRPHFFRVPAFASRMVFGETADLFLTPPQVVNTKIPDSFFDYPTLSHVLKT